MIALKNSELHSGGFSTVILAMPQQLCGLARYEEGKGKLYKASPFTRH